MSFPPALPTSSIFIHLRASPDSRLWRRACIALVIDLLLTFCPTRGEEKDRLCRTKDFWKHVRNLRPGCCQRLSFWACSPSAGGGVVGVSGLSFPPPTPPCPPPFKGTAATIQPAPRAGGGGGKARPPSTPLSPVRPPLS